MDYFTERGCVVSDHGLDYAEFCPLSEEEENALVKKSLAGETLTEEELKQYRTMCMLFLGAEYKKRKLGHAASLWCKARE